MMGKEDKAKIEKGNVLGIFSYQITGARLELDMALSIVTTAMGWPNSSDA